MKPTILNTNQNGFKHVRQSVCLSTKQALQNNAIYRAYYFQNIRRTIAVEREFCIMGWLGSLVPLRHTSIILTVQTVI